MSLKKPGDVFLESVQAVLKNKDDHNIYKLSSWLELYIFQFLPCILYFHVSLKMFQ